MHHSISHIHHTPLPEAEAAVSLAGAQFWTSAALHAAHERAAQERRQQRRRCNMVSTPQHGPRSWQGGRST
jgi:hypothetical protein